MEKLQPEKNRSHYDVYVDSENIVSLQKEGKAFELLKKMGECPICRGVIKDKEDGITCSSCQNSVCKSCFDNDANDN